MRESIPRLCETSPAHYLSINKWKVLFLFVFAVGLQGCGGLIPCIVAGQRDSLAAELRARGRAARSGVHALQGACNYQYPRVPLVHWPRPAGLGYHLWYGTRVRLTFGLDLLKPLAWTIKATHLWLFAPYPTHRACCPAGTIASEIRFSRNTLQKAYSRSNGSSPLELPVQCVKRPLSLNHAWSTRNREPANDE